MVTHMLDSSFGRRMNELRGVSQAESIEGCCGKRRLPVTPTHRHADQSRRRSCKVPTQLLRHALPRFFPRPTAPSTAKPLSLDVLVIEILAPLRQLRCGVATLPLRIATPTALTSALSCKERHTGAGKIDAQITASGGLRALQAHEASLRPRSAVLRPLSSPRQSGRLRVSSKAFQKTVAHRPGGG